MLTYRMSRQHGSGFSVLLVVLLAVSSTATSVVAAIPDAVSTAASVKSN